MGNGRNDDPFSPQEASSKPYGSEGSFGAEKVVAPQAALPRNRQIALAVRPLISVVLIFMFGFSIAEYIDAKFAPMRKLEVVVLVVFLTVPLFLLAVNLLSAKIESMVSAFSPFAGNRGDVSKAVRRTFKVLLFIAIGTVFYGVVVALNGVLDHSPVTPHTLTVTEKSYRSGKNHHRSYYAVVDSPAQPILPFSFGRTERLPVDAALYRRIEAGVTEVVLETHDGYLGLPWIAAYDFTGPFAETAPVSPNRGDAQLTDVPAFDTTIEPLTPDTIKREYWPNGALKQEEPMVRGQIHGLARYWFDNGKPYGEIPWKQGRKHGRFMLYRPDGTPEQSLSYKDGQPHGVLAWYNGDGSLQQKWLYVDGDAKKRLN